MNDNPTDDNGFKALHDQIAALREELLGLIGDQRREMYALHNQVLGRFDALAGEVRALRREFLEHVHVGVMPHHHGPDGNVIEESA